MVSCAALRHSTLLDLVTTWLVLGLATALATAAAGCARVKPYQREYLARPAMVSDRDPGQMRFSQHQTGSREGADGGTGEPGGGCGCN
jgi:Domain of unknown function (DUF4266)